MNSKLKRVLARFLSDQMPVVRKGGSRSARLVTILSPGKALRVIPAADIGLLRIVEDKDQKFALVTGTETLAQFETREDAAALLNKIHRLVAPSPWRWFWRFVIVVLLYNFFVPSTPPRDGASPASASISATPPSTALATMPGPTVPQPAQRNDEPFGLPLSPAAGQ